MTTCDFIELSEYIIKCINCGIVLEIKDDHKNYPVFPCFGALATPVKATDTDAKQIKKNASEMKPEHIDESDMCSEEQILARYALCGRCDFFENNTCSKCGCLLSRNKVYMSKLAWKNESCPIGLWSKISD